MTITGGRYDDPNFVMRQMLHLGNTTAGAAGTSLRHSFPYQVRVRRITSAVQVAGTAATAAANYIVLSGTTTTTGSGVVQGTAAANTVGTSADMNLTVPTGAICYITNGADATGTQAIDVEYHLDPQATWDAT